MGLGEPVTSASLSYDGDGVLLMATGVRREWFGQTTKDMMDPNRGLSRSRALQRALRCDLGEDAGAENERGDTVERPQHVQLTSTAS